jgi:hypothetical protein
MSNEIVLMFKVPGLNLNHSHWNLTYFCVAQQLLLLFSLQMSPIRCQIIRFTNMYTIRTFNFHENVWKLSTGI